MKSSEEDFEPFKLRQWFASIYEIYVSSEASFILMVFSLCRNKKWYFVYVEIKKCISDMDNEINS